VFKQLRGPFVAHDRVPYAKRKHVMVAPLVPSANETGGSLEPKSSKPAWAT
jgi:hypothetical protein